MITQVKGKGKIVKKEWVERCHSERKRLPWRRFCLDNVRMGDYHYHTPARGTIEIIPPEGHIT